jgi:4-amino-4-deoxy-L-arabinose transferase-like glycosyltransferase
VGETPVREGLGCEDLRRMPARFAVTTRQLVCAVVPLVVLYAVGVTGRWWPTPDSAAYLGLARSLASGHGYVFDGEVNTHFTPGFPLVLAGMRLAFGDGYLAPNILMALCGLATILVMYRVMRMLMRDEHLAFAATLCAAFSYAFYVGSHRILSDVPFALFFWLMLYAILEFLRGGVWWLAGAGILAGAATAMRAPGVLLIAPVALGVALTRGGAATGRRIVAAVVPCAAAGMVFVALYLAARAASSGPLPYAHIVAAGLNAAASHYFVTRIIKVIEGLPALASALFVGKDDWLPVGYVIVLLVAVGLVRLWKRGERLPATVIVVFTAAMAVAIGSFGLQDRYYLPILPLVTWAYFAGVAALVDAIQARRPDLNGFRGFRWAVVGVTAFTISCNTPRIAREAFYYSHLGTQRFYERVRSDSTQSAAIAETINRVCPSGTRLATMPEAASIIHYLTGRFTEPYLGVIRSPETEAATALEFVRSHPEVSFVLADSPPVIAAFDGEKDLAAVLRGRVVLYRRTTQP